MNISENQHGLTIEFTIELTIEFTIELTIELTSNSLSNSLSNPRNVPRGTSRPPSPRDVELTAGRPPAMATSNSLSNSLSNPRDVPRGTSRPPSPRDVELTAGRPPAKGGGGAEKSLGAPSYSRIIAHSFARTHDTYTKTKPKSISRLGSLKDSPPQPPIHIIYIPGQPKAVLRTTFRVPMAL